MIQERKLSMPFWCVGNPVGDPFGPGVLTGVSSIEVAELLAAAGRKGLINYSAAHDDDLVPWDPAKPEDDLDESSEVHKTLVQIKKILTSGNIKFNMIGCALHPDPVFRNGGIANPDPRVRLLAAQKVMRALRIGSFLGADFFTYWVARDGFETQFSVPWDKTYRYLQEALNLVPRYCKTNNLTIKHATIEYKPNEPRGEMFLPTVGHSVALISTLEDPDFWGVNPEVLQHDAMHFRISICFLDDGKQLILRGIRSQREQLCFTPQPGGSIDNALHVIGRCRIFSHLDQTHLGL